MQMFGLVSLLVTIAVVAWWLTSSLGPLQPKTDENGQRQESTYQEAIDSAHEAVGSMETKNNQLPAVSGSGQSVTVYTGISVPDNTTVLNLSGRDLSGSLKAEIRLLRHLRQLDISNNNFTGLPAEVGQLSELEVLNLSKNPFTGLPYELGNLQNLRVLDLRGTHYAEQDLAIIKSHLPASAQILVD